jgi:hypothetical protein
MLLGEKIYPYEFQEEGGRALTGMDRREKGRVECISGRVEGGRRRKEEVSGGWAAEEKVGDSSEISEGRGMRKGMEERKRREEEEGGEG